MITETVVNKAGGHLKNILYLDDGPAWYDACLPAVNLGGKSDTDTRDEWITTFLKLTSNVSVVNRLRNVGRVIFRACHSMLNPL